MFRPTVDNFKGVIKNETVVANYSYVTVSRKCYSIFWNSLLSYCFNLQIYHRFYYNIL